MSLFSWCWALFGGPLGVDIKNATCKFDRPDRLILQRVCRSWKCERRTLAVFRVWALMPPWLLDFVSQTQAFELRLPMEIASNLDTI